MANYDNIYKRYNDLYASQNNALNQKKNSAIQGYQNQQNDMNNQYADISNSLKTKMAQNKSNYGQQQGDVNAKYKSLFNTYNTQKTDNASKFKNLYTGLDQQRGTAKETKYTDSNTVDTGVNQNLNRVQELMAKNGWSGGGENLAAQLSSNSDRSNGQGKVTQDYNKDMQGIANTQHGYQGQEQGINNEIAGNVADSQATQTSDLNKLLNAYNDNTNTINNEMTSNASDQKTKIQAIMDSINSTNVNYGADSNALRSNLDAQAGAEVYQEEQVAKQQAYAAAQLVKQQAYEKQQMLEQRAYAEKQQAIAYQRQAVAQQDS